MDAIQAMGTYKASLEVFGDAAHEEMLRTDVGFDQAAAKIDALHDHCKSEMTRMTEAFSRRPWAVSDHLELRKVADHAVITLEALHQQFRSALAIWHGKD